MKPRSILSFYLLFMCSIVILAGQENNFSHENKKRKLTDSLYQIASFHFDNKQFDSSLFVLTLIEERAKQASQNYSYSKILLLKGKNEYCKNDYQKAEQSFTLGINTSKTYKFKLLEGKFLERMASLNLHTGNSNLALKLYFESLLIFEELNDSIGIAKVYNIMGVYHADMGDYDLAKAYLNKSLRIHNNLNDYYNIIENKANMAYLYENMGEKEKALEVYLNMISEVSELGDSFALSVIHYSIGSIYHEKNDLDLAFKHLKLAISMAKMTNDTALLGSFYGHLGDLYIETAKNDSARLFLNQSTICAQAVGDINSEISSLESIAKLDSAAGHFKEQILIHKQINDLTEKYFIQKSENNIKTIELEFENKKSQNKIIIQNQIIESNNRNKKLTYILLALSILSLFLLGFIFILQKKSNNRKQRISQQQIKLNQLQLEKVQQQEALQKQEKEIIEEELCMKERELVNSALQINQRKEELHDICNKIDILIKEKSVSTSDLKELDKAIRFRMKDHDNWELFYQAFSQVHKDFFINLKEKHPCLTKSELKHCAYIRIHLSSNQMSSILNVTIDAVRKTRYRIRKKLELKPEDSLEDYLMNY